MKKLIFILLSLTMISCHSVITENVIITRIELNDVEGNKYKVYLDAFPGETILYTNKVYVVGDTLK